MKHKIGIVTSARELNFGALLQAYALQNVINKLGFNSQLLWWKNQKKSHRDVRIVKLFYIFWHFVCHPAAMRKSLGAYGHTFTKEFTKRSIAMFQDYEDKYLNIKFFNYREMKEYASSPECKAIIAGSDQIWNSYAIYVDPFYYLRFAPKSKRIAYAPSLGKSDIPSYNRAKIKKYVEGFYHLSVREKSGKKLLYQLTGIDVPVVLDPSFLLKNIEWQKIEKSIPIKEKYVLFYFLDEPNEYCIDILKKIVAKFGYNIKAVPYKYPSFKLIDSLEYIDAGPCEFLSLVHYAELVLTDSFHGSALSINYNKQFIVFDRQYGLNQSQVSRILDLLDTFGLQRQFVRDESEIERACTCIDYQPINKIMEKLRKESINYLYKSIS